MNKARKTGNKTPVESFRIFEQLALALKTDCDLKFYTVMNVLFTFKIFEQLVLALKTEFALKFFNPEWRQPPRLVRLWVIVVNV